MISAAIQHTDVPSDAAAIARLVARLSVGFVFLPSAVAKLAHLRSFIAGVHDYRILPRRAAKWAGVAIPLVELVLAAALISGSELALAGYLTGALLVAFTLAIVINIRRHRTIPCNCGGIAGNRPIGWGSVARNGLLLVLLVPAAAAGGRTAAPGSISASVLVAVLTVGCVAVVSLAEWAVESMLDAHS